MELVEKIIHEPGNQPFDEQVATDELAHETAHRPMLPERYERSPVSVVKIGERLALRNEWSGANSERREPMQPDQHAIPFHHDWAAPKG